MVSTGVRGLGGDDNSGENIEAELSAPPDSTYLHTHLPCETV